MVLHVDCGASICGILGLGVVVSQSESMDRLTQSIQIVVPRKSALEFNELVFKNNL